MMLGNFLYWKFIIHIMGNFLPMMDLSRYCQIMTQMVKLGMS